MAAKQTTLSTTPNAACAEAGVTASLLPSRLVLNCPTCIWGSTEELAIVRPPILLTGMCFNRQSAIAIIDSFKA